MKQKGLAPILIILLVTALAAGGYFVYMNYSKSQYKSPTQESPSETASWKQYKDPKNRFEFKYPQEFREYKSERAVIFNKSGKVESPHKGGLQLIEYSLNEYEIPEGLASEDGLYKFDVNKKQWVFSKGSSGYNVPKLVDGNLEAYISKVGGGLCAGNRIIILEPSYTNVIEIVSTACLDSIDEDVNVDSTVDQRTKNILSTFKFTQ